MRTINTGVIGTGFIGPVHIEALRRLGYVNVVAIADVDQKTAEKKAEQLNVPKAYGNYMDLINDPDVECVHICAPNYLHYDMVKAALRANKHILCDKPLAMSAAEAAELTALAAQSPVTAAINFNVRFYPVLYHVREMIESGELGEVFSVNGSYQQDWLQKQTDYSWRLEPEKFGKSRAVVDIGSHWMDTAEFISGLKVTEVFADFATFHKTRKKPLRPVETYSGKVLTVEDYQEVPISTEDYATVLLHFDSGAHGSMTVNQAAAGDKNRIYFEIFGSKRGIRFNSERSNELWIGERDAHNGLLLRDPSLLCDAARRITAYPGGHNEGFPDTFKQCFHSFYTYILSDGKKRGLPADFPTFADGQRELMLAENILESAKKSAWVSVK